VKVPTDVQVKIEELGKRALNEDASEVDLGEEGAGWLQKNQPLVALGILSEWFRGRVRSWVYSQTRGALDGESEQEQLVLPFSELPPYIEIAPGMKKHQRMMTGRDWDNALAIYRNRRDQAEVSFRALERCHREVRPLLVGDLRTADILGQLRAAISVAS
jgi:hypothetical protein